MPVYEYQCKHCHKVIEDYQPIAKHRKMIHCPICGGKATQIPSRPNLQTDTNFVMNGKAHIALSQDNDDVIRGRSDYKRRLREKGLRELDPAELHKPHMPEIKPCM